MRSSLTPDVHCDTDPQVYRATATPVLTTRTDLKIAVLIPCFNEEISIGVVVEGFRASLPSATIYVYDNNSTDRTIEVARTAGAIVRRERLQGKGNVVKRMFADVDADLYVLVDGDATYDPSAAPTMVEVLVNEQLDVVNASRITDIKEAYRHGHRFGNVLLTGMVKLTFGTGFDDLLSGYKILSRRFVKSLPLMSRGFEIETELAVHALSLRMPIAEVGTRYRDRATGSTSKLRTYRDGFRILRVIVKLLKEERPLAFFGCLALLLALLAVGLGFPLVITYLQTGLVPRLPTAVLSASLMVLSSLALTCGLILDTVTRGRNELKRLAYLAMSGVRTSSVD
jgi:glycosyltransferase involved in cell wall biosynthesis